ncbi:hypothetical protein K2224_34340 (plasmid) [Streptomyces sp. BHT-5-2]|uniref:hypothetical protein n=1 Tax=Streptomyces sp. BHT-5-2 TaxID=2866715 RepID=UPI001C8D33AD|nr:hypothetical protein [Streptomyces sp. BHT-5-2]QZL08214.1 hypothetical protein K2224_34340 [Streptomyces sp. BHT-5-2]
MSTHGDGWGGSLMVVLDADTEAYGKVRGAVCGEALRVLGGSGVDDQLSAEWRELVVDATAGTELRDGAAGRLSGVLLGVPDATPYLGVLRLLADLITVRSATAGGFAETGPAAFGPVFWRCLALSAADRLELLRRLLPADGPRADAPRTRPPRAFAPPPRVRVHTAGAAAAGAVDDGADDGWVDALRWADGPAGPHEGGAEAFRPGGAGLRPGRFLDLVAELLKADPERIQPLLCGWFDDNRPLRTAPDAPHVLTVADAAQALLHTHRARALDALVETLAGVAHPRAAELLDALAEDEPAALRRATARWGSGPRTGGRPAAPEPTAAAAETGRWPAGPAGWPMQQRPGPPSRVAALPAWQS